MRPRPSRPGKGVGEDDAIAARNVASMRPRPSRPGKHDDHPSVASGLVDASMRPRPSRPGKASCSISGAHGRGRFNEAPAQ